MEDAEIKMKRSISDQEEKTSRIDVGENMSEYECVVGVCHRSAGSEQRKGLFHLSAQNLNTFIS
jgi:hypothetical protein